MSQNKKLFVLDTSAIIALVQDITTYRGSNSPGFACVLGDNEVVIPRVVLDELTKLRRDLGDRGKIALEAARQLEGYSSKGSLIDGIETEKGGILRIAPSPSYEKMLALELSPEVADHNILATAIELDDDLRKSNESSGSSVISSVVLITQDRILRVLARSIYGIDSEELRSICAPDMGFTRGIVRVELSGEEVDEVIQNGAYIPNDDPGANDFYHLVNRENPDVHYCYALAKQPGVRYAELVDRASVDYLKVAGEVSGRNVRQKLLLWSLMGCGDPDPMSEDGIRLITISGPAGTGKSFLTLAAAWERLTRGHFERIVITRPMVDVGTSMGYLPGTLEEKLRPWGGPIEDNLRAIVNVPSPDDGRGGAKKGVQRATRPFDAKSWLEMENRLEMVPLTYIRGRTFRKTFVILEEAQNLERGPLKVLLTRLGEGSIVVILGDTSQIDNQFLSKRNNGLVHAMNAFRDWPQAIHLNLESIVRSDLAEAADRLL